MSTAETTKVKAKLAALVSAFDALDAQLAPLFAQTLPETLVGLEPLQQAKLQTALPYLVYDLIFIYLKSKGIDPRTHPVIGELDRIRQYFDKISNAENPPAKRVEVDKAAAGRFIKHALAQSQLQWKKTAAEDMQAEPNADADAAASSSSSSRPAAEKVSVKVTEKMRARAAYEAQLKASADGDEAEAGLEVFGEDAKDGEEEEEEDDDVEMEMEAEEVTQSTGKGKGKASDSASTQREDEVGARSTAAKRRRPVLDPFAGYGDDATPSGSPAPSAKTKKAKSSPTSTPSSAPSPSATSTAKMAKKKGKKTEAAS